mgnify:CR=1 FL=1
MYSDAYEAAGGQKELELMCLYEIGINATNPPPPPKFTERHFIYSYSQ